jgi:molybdopterin synthase catalytic subunit
VLVEAPIDLAALQARVVARSRGALVLFVGTVRDLHDGRRVTGIRYDAYRPLAERAIAAIAADLEREHAGLACAIVHRLGELAAGEASIAIACAAPRRDAAFAAARRALERVKREAPIWKLERYADGSAAWREEEPLAPAGR